MKLGEGVEWGAHCTALLAALPEGMALSSATLAAFHGVKASYLVKQLKALSKAGILESLPGPRGGFRLARPASTITLLDIVDAIGGREPLFRCTEITRCFPSNQLSTECPHFCEIKNAMGEAERAWRESLAKVTMLELNRQISTRQTPAQREQARQWLETYVPDP